LPRGEVPLQRLTLRLAVAFAACGLEALVRIVEVCHRLGACAPAANGTQGLLANSNSSFAITTPSTD